MNITISSASKPTDMTGRAFRDQHHGLVTVLSQRARYVPEDGLSFGLGDDRGWLLTLTCRPATDDEARPILAEEERERTAAELGRARQEGRRTLFAPTAGEYVEPAEGQIHLQGVEVPWGDGRTLYGGGEWFVVVDAGPHAGIWHVINNGADGDDWSRNNVATGGAGGIGRRFAPTPERLAFLRALPGGDAIGKTMAERQREAIDAYHHGLVTLPRWLTEPREHATAEEAAADARLLAERSEQLAELTALIGCGPVGVGRAPEAPGLVWTKIGGAMVGMPLDGSGVYVKAPRPDGAPYPWEIGLRSNEGGDGLLLRYEATPEHVAAIRGRWPGWVGTAAPGRYSTDHFGAYVADNAADALRAAACRGVTVAGVRVTPDVTIVYADPGVLDGGSRGVLIWSDGHVTPVGGDVTVWSVASKRAALAASIAERDAAGKEVHPYERKSLADGCDPWGRGFPEVPDAPVLTMSVSPAAARLLRLAVVVPWWREEKRYERLYSVAEEQRTRVKHREDHRPRASEEVTLYRVDVSHVDGRAETLWLVHGAWGCMGEDGDAGDDYELHEHEAAARESYRTMYVREGR